MPSVGRVGWAEEDVAGAVNEDGAAEEMIVAEVVVVVLAGAVAVVLVVLVRPTISTASWSGVCES